MTITVTARDPHGATAEIRFQVLDVSAPASKLWRVIALASGATKCSGGYAAFIVSNYNNRAAAELAALDGCIQRGWTKLPVVMSWSLVVPTLLATNVARLHTVRMAAEAAT